MSMGTEAAGADDEAVVVVSTVKVCCWEAEAAAVLKDDDERRLCVLGSSPCAMSFFLMQEFQKFFTSLSVLPGKCFAI